MIYTLMILLGLALGSFVNALVWRIHQQDFSKKKQKELSILKGRSMCPDCKHELKSKDLVPVLSWLWLRGKCRYCNKPISVQYPLVELAGAVLVVVSYTFWPYDLSGFASYVLFALWVVIVINSLALAVYDLKWMILPNRLVFTLMGLALAYVLALSLLLRSPEEMVSAAIGCLAYGGFFYVLYQISGGKWIGGGDVRLGFALGLLLGWQKSILGLTLAAYLGTLVIIILFVLGRYHKKMRLPFGPFLLSGAFIAILWGQQVIDWYLSLSGM